MWNRYRSLPEILFSRTNRGCSMEESKGTYHIETGFQDTSCFIIPLDKFFAIKCTSAKRCAHVERKGLLNGERVCGSVCARFVGSTIRELIKRYLLSIEERIANFTVCSTVLGRTRRYRQVGRARAVGIHHIFEGTASWSTTVITLVYRVSC